MSVVWLWPVAVLSPLCLVLLTFRWSLFLRSRGSKFRFFDLLPILWGGQFCNTFLPGAVGGDVYKAVIIARMSEGAKAESAATVVLDRFCALVTLGALGAAGLWEERTVLGEVFAQGVNIPRGIAVGGGVAVATAILTTFAFFAIPRLKPSRLAIAAILVRIWSTLLAGLTEWKVMAVAVFVSLLIHLSNFAIFYCLGRGLHFELTFGQVMLIMPMVILIAMLPITINGHGLREVLLTAYFLWANPGRLIGLGAAEAAIAISFLYVANDLVWNLPGGLLMVLRKPKTSIDEH